MRFRFLGGAGEIGRLGLVVEHDGRRLCIDHGMEPDTPPKVPDPAPPLDGLLLTHAHLDHSGMVPALVRERQMDVWCTPVTRKVSNILHHDSIKIADIEGYPRPFEPEDAVRTESHCRDITPNDSFDVGGMEVRTHRAGHIPGALQFEIVGDRTMLFTGDLYTQDTRLVKRGRPTTADILFIESTYAGRSHPDRGAEEDRLVARVKETVERGGLALIPAFATGRCQEVLLTLVAKTDLEIWVDGMGARVLDIFLSEGDSVADRRALKAARSRVRIVRNHRQRRLAAKTADVVVCTSGMLDGGPVLYYLEQHRNDTRASLLLTGYQVEGTNGRRLLDHGTIVDRGLEVPVRMQLDRFDLSTHLDHGEIVDYVRRTQCRDVVLYHGYAREKLIDDLSDLATVHTPDRGETFEL